MRLDDFLVTMEQIAPTKFAESWDNVGLLAGDPQQEISRAMLCIDYTGEVACEAAGEKCDLIIAYHPPIFETLKWVTAGSLVFDAIQRGGAAIYSPHTALDAADGGTNDVLADAIGLTERGPLRVASSAANQLKLVTFVPAEHVDRVSAALFDAGAGRIGKYSSCSFRSPGTGTFFGEAGTNPAVGQSQKLEHAAEIRLEMVAPLSKLSEIIAALRKSHPYEEPAFDLVQTAAPPPSIGQGRLGFPMPHRRLGRRFFARIKRELGLDHLLIAGPTDGEIFIACQLRRRQHALDDALAAQRRCM